MPLTVSYGDAIFTHCGSSSNVDHVDFPTFSTDNLAVLGNKKKGRARKLVLGRLIIFRQLLDHGRLGTNGHDPYLVSSSGSAAALNVLDPRRIHAAFDQVLKRTLRNFIVSVSRHARTICSRIDNDIEQRIRRVLRHYHTVVETGLVIVVRYRIKLVTRDLGDRRRLFYGLDVGRYRHDFAAAAVVNVVINVKLGLDRLISHSGRIDNDLRRSLAAQNASIYDSPNILERDRGGTLVYRGEFHLFALGHAGRPVDHKSVRTIFCDRLFNSLKAYTFPNAAADLDLALVDLAARARNFYSVESGCEVKLGTGTDAAHP